MELGINLSSLYDKKVYDDEGVFLGKVNDIIVDLESGRVIKLLLAPFKGSNENKRKILRDKSVDFEKVISISDIVVVKTSFGNNARPTISINENKGVRY